MHYELEEEEQAQTEIHLSNSKLLLIFLFAAVLCGACFGFGYSMGKHGPARTGLPLAATTPDSAPAPIARSVPASAAASTSALAPARPSPRTLADNGQTASVTVDESPAAAPALPSPAPRAVRVAPPAAPPVTRAVVVKAEPSEPASPQVSGSALAGGRSYIVQVAAVSHPGDANILVSALHRKGYQASAVASPQDSLTHVQVGPFGTQKDALAMRDRLSGDGYLAIVK